VVVATNFKDNIKQEHFEQAFSYFDIDRSGAITFEEICQFLDEESTTAIK
jgi:Ca2+-binding EF-hand superfamily protein